MILERLQKVRQTAPGEWVACCPAHNDKSPSLSIKEDAERGYLLHCFAGCTPVEVLRSIGATWGDIFPEGRSQRVEGLKPIKWAARTVLTALAHNATVVAIMASDIAKGAEVTKEDAEKLHELAGEIHAICDITR